MRLIPITRCEPHLGPAPDYSQAFYANPPSHDFCVWLVTAELMRRYHGAPAPLKVRFGLTDGQLGVVDYGNRGVLSGPVHRCNLSRAYSDQMIANVLRPAIEMMGAVEEPAVHLSDDFDYGLLSRYVEYDYHIGDLVDAGREGFDIPKWQVPQWAHREAYDYVNGDRPVVITLREAPAQPERNSQIAEWLKFASSIHDRYRVVFVRDTAEASQELPSRGNPFDPFETCPRASTNVYFRAALYQQAFCNLMVCNGPNTWVIFSDARYLIFKQLVPALPQWHHGQPRGWLDQDHMEVGDQYPWATPQQRMTWTDDTYENIVAAFETFLETIK